MQAERNIDTKGLHLAGRRREAILMERRYITSGSHRASCDFPLVLSSIL